jgi:hypothetical protein
MSTLHEKPPLRIGRVRHHAHMDAAISPAGYAESGEAMVFETQDACYG